MDCTNGTTSMTDEKAAPLSIPISVEQLQALITEAVEKAVESMEKTNKVPRDEKMIHGGEL